MGNFKFPIADRRDERGADCRRAAFAPACCLCHLFGAPACTAPAPACAPAYTPPPTVVNYVPQTCYRTMYQPTPVTSYQPVTTADPCSGCPRTSLMPVTTGRSAAGRCALYDLSTGLYDGLRAVYRRLCPVHGGLRAVYRRLCSRGRDCSGSGLWLLDLRLLELRVR